MKTSELSRVEFTKWLGSLDGRAVTSVEGVPSRAAGTVTLAWLDASASKHPIICVKAAEMREFLAFISTYVGTYVPFTAFFRIIPLEMLEFLPHFSNPALDDAVLERALIGVALVEASLQSRTESFKVDDTTVQACAATTASIVGRCVQLSYSNPLAIVALERAETVKEGMVGPGMRTDRAPIRIFWETVLSALTPETDETVAGVSRGAVEFVASVFASKKRGHDVRPGTFDSLAPGLNDQFLMLRSNREDRVRALEQIFIRIRESKMPTPTSEIVMGYAAAQVAEGSFSYIPLISRYGKDLPLAPLWFGLFSGMTPESDVLTISNCIGRRVLRQFETIPGLLPLIDADLNYEEFFIYKSELQSRKIRTDYPSIISVELIPGISYPLRLPRLSETNQSSARPSERVTADQQERARSLERVRQLAAELNHVMSRLQRYEEPVTASLFPDENLRSETRKTTPRKRVTRTLKSD